MSDIIRLLPDNIANQIAAGEVIQRPASVVKELIENAVDAGATHIELHIKDAGRTSIQVIDNGKGMSEMDARMCFERHATSKLKSADDLFNLSTKGFRGEAMASIAAIAHVTLETRLAGSDIGTKIEIQGSKVTNQEPIARAEGTSISVKNLFFNVPARRNFLKSDNVETKHIVEEFNRVVLTHPDISFKFTHNGTLLHDLPGTGLRKRIVDLQGTNFNTKLVPIHEETDIVTISGFVGKPEFARKTRGEQYFFVNNRFFKDSYFHHAITAAFENLLPPKTFPSYFIYLTVPPQSIDVNIHPTKTEIKFEEDRNIYSIIRSTVKLALGKHNIAPSLDFEQEPQFDVFTKENDTIKPPTIKVDPNYNPFKTTSSSPSSSSGGGGKRTASSAMRPNTSDWENFYEITQEEKDTATPQQETLLTEKQPSFNKYVQLHSKYLVAQIDEGMITIHLKRAKERILYDELMAQFMLKPIGSQQLLFPIEYTLSATEKLEWENHEDSIKRLGFDWEWNKNTLVLSGIPSHIGTDETHHCIDEIVQKMAYEKVDKGEIAHVLIASIANAASHGIKQNLTKEEVEHITNELFLCEDYVYSPKGKKIIHTTSINELNKLFE